MFGIFKNKKKKPEVPSVNLEDKGFFSKALEKTLGNIKHIVPLKKRENCF